MSSCNLLLFGCKEATLEAFHSVKTQFHDLSKDLHGLSFVRRKLLDYFRSVDVWEYWCWNQHLNRIEYIHDRRCIVLSDLTDIVRETSHQTDDFTCSLEHLLAFGNLWNCFDWPVFLAKVSEVFLALCSSSLSIPCPHDLCKLQPSVINNDQTFLLCLWVQLSVSWSHFRQPFLYRLDGVILHLHVVKAIQLGLLSVTLKNTFNHSLDPLVSFHLDLGHLFWRKLSWWSTCFTISLCLGSWLHHVWV